MWSSSQDGRLSELPRLMWLHSIIFVWTSELSEALQACFKLAKCLAVAVGIALREGRTRATGGGRGRQSHVPFPHLKLLPFLILFALVPNYISDKGNKLNFINLLTGSF